MLVSLNSFTTVTIMPYSVGGDGGGGGGSGGGYTVVKSTTL